MNTGTRVAAGTKPFLRNRRKATETKPYLRKDDGMEFSKRLITDIRALLWVVTVGGLLLAACCIRVGYTGALPWLTAMVGLPWTAHGTVCAFYLNMAKSDHREGGITFEAAKESKFKNTGSANSPSI